MINIAFDEEMMREAIAEGKRPPHWEKPPSAR